MAVPIDHAFRYTGAAGSEQDCGNIIGLIGVYNEPPMPNADEVSEWQYVDLPDLEKDVNLNPENYTVWFREIYAKVKDHFFKEA